MGANETKYSEKPKVKDPAIEVTSGWSLHTSDDLENCSVFSGPNENPLTVFTNNLKIYRHPSIIRYISSYQSGGQLNLVIEQVTPLSQFISNLIPLQKLIGLQNIASAVLFLHEKAQSSHNNICMSAIYITSDYLWKLGGLQFITKLNNTNNVTLGVSRENRYQKAISPEELSKGRIIPELVDSYAFGILCEEVLRDSSELPYFTEFSVFIKEQLLSPSEKRCRFNQILDHPFFQHDIIRIYKFLSELPLYDVKDKHQFFSELESNLKNLPETLVGTQLLPLLLSRVVLLDEAAQQNLLPIILKPGELFSEETFKQYVVPKILKIFCVRDTAIRLLLLSYLKGCLHMFTADQLRQDILPHLLVGIKDECDTLVSETLHAVADLVLVLGANVVVGGRRAKLFTDGRPGAAPASIPTPQGERPRPDGGEDLLSADPRDDEEEDEEGDFDHGVSWSSWDDLNETAKTTVEGKLVTKEVADKAVLKEIPLTELDIKSSTKSLPKNTRTTEDDFFRDMEPVISKTPIAVSINEPVNRLQVSDANNPNEDGWQDSFPDWLESEDDPQS